MDVEEPLFQPFPSDIVFQNFEPFETYEVPLQLRNNDKVSLYCAMFVIVLMYTNDIITYFMALYKYYRKHRAYIMVIIINSIWYFHTVLSYIIKCGSEIIRP